MRLVQFALISVTFACSANAQDTDAAQMSASHLSLPKDDDAVRQVHDYAMCAAGSSRIQARLVLRSYPASAASDRALFWTEGNSCASSAVAKKYSPRALRGPLAELFFKRDFVLSTWQQKNKPLTLYKTPSNDQLAKLAADVRANIIMVEVGSCAAKADRAGVTELLSSQAGSIEEKDAFARLSKSLASCVPAGVDMMMSRFQLRGYLAEGAYRVAASFPTGTN